jgi:AcrR family transcriptional regulator
MSRSHGSCSLSVPRGELWRFAPRRLHSPVSTLASVSELSERRGTARERLLRAAAELTYQDGIEATGVDAIAARAGVTKRTLYQHFRSKDELVGAALAGADESTIAQLRAAIDRRIAKGARPVPALFAVLERTFAQSTFRGCAFINAGLEMRDPQHQVRPAVRSHTDARRALIGELVQAEGVTDERTIDAIALIVEGAFATGAARHDPAAARRGARAAEQVLKNARDCSRIVARHAKNDAGSSG